MEHSMIMTITTKRASDLRIRDIVLNDPGYGTSAIVVARPGRAYLKTDVRLTFRNIYLDDTYTTDVDGQRIFETNFDGETRGSK